MFNEALEKALHLPEKIYGANILSLLHLKDANGKSATSESLSIDQALVNKVTYFVKGFELETRFDKNFKVSIQINPITDPSGEINQISFIITEARVAEPSTHFTLEQARQRRKMMLDNLKSTLVNAHLTSAEIQVFLLSKIEEDLILAQDLEDHLFKQETSLVDLVELCQKVKLKKELFARALKIPLQLNLSKDEVEETAYLSLKKSNVSDKVLIPSPFSALTDPKWLSILLDKLIDISMLIVLGRPNPGVSLSLTREGDKEIVILITSYPVQIEEFNKVNLFEAYYGNLAATTNLRLGSGLEGFIAKAISSELKLPIEVSIKKEVLVMSIKVPKGTH